MRESVVAKLRAALTAEKEQALFYRALSTIAEERGALEDSEALNGLLADEQHHLSRLSVRLVELGQETGDVSVQTAACEFADWRQVARGRERAEIERYEALLDEPLDEETSALLRQFLEVERQHEQNLGGKYTEA